ncbi:DUF58 domain-containing protein [Spartinivicinus poritis]|uniref:DUF58 domain-containing protein n=1 Tax=Spartinivicinus poritis TaxID=2994640 RepID=A0ABT5U408_9GAMM|nr:DUF58 domain-containing protein [Spartinivicinus sp. A2-2]MDE1461110.1 DUF58 domain-containing protein [Spartinivicinus sp. A2-2]
MNIAKQWQAYFSSWLNRRIPPSHQVTLNQKRLFILPSRTGYILLFVVLAIFLAAVNYENSMSFAVAFLLISLFVVAILHTYNNLAGMELIGVNGGAAHVGDDVGFELKLKASTPKKGHESVRLYWPQGIPQLASIEPAGETNVKVFLPAERRGYFKPGRLCIESYYPLGLLRCWTWVDLDITALIYPKPIKCHLPYFESASIEGQTLAKDGVEDFAGLRDYHPGDGLRHIAWKQYSKTDTLLTKDFSAFTDRRRWLDWENIPGADLEIKLSHLCYWCMRCEQFQEDYGLRLPGITIEPGRGQMHLRRCLTELALFQV